MSAQPRSAVLEAHYSGTYGAISRSVFRWEPPCIPTAVCVSSLNRRGRVLEPSPPQGGYVLDDLYGQLWVRVGSWPLTDLRKHLLCSLGTDPSHRMLCHIPLPAPTDEERWRLFYVRHKWTTIALERRYTRREGAFVELHFPGKGGSSGLFDAVDQHTLTHTERETYSHRHTHRHTHGPHRACPPVYLPVCVCVSVACVLSVLSVLPLLGCIANT